MPFRPRRAHAPRAPRAALLSLSLAAALASCGDSTGPDDRTPAAVAAASTASQMGTVGAAVPTPPSVRVTDAEGRPVGNASVSFTVTAGGGTVSPATVTTDADGRATVASWTLGQTSGTNGLRATVGSLQPVDFTAEAVPGPATQLAFVSPAGATVVSGTPLPTLEVELRDAYGNRATGSPMEVRVSLAQNPTQGVLTGTTAVQAQQGIARFVGLRLDKAGAYTMAAEATGLPAVGGWDFSVRAGLPSAAMEVSPVNPIGTVGMPVRPGVRVIDAYGNPVVGHAVAFAALHGSVSAATVHTDATGIAAVDWTLGTTAGSQTLRATPSGLPVVTITAHARPGAPAALTKLAGDGQRGTTNATLADAILVTVRDQYGNPVPGVTVTFTVTAGGGWFYASELVSDQFGNAGSLWYLGGAPGTHTLQVATAGATPVTFSAIAATPVSGIISGNMTWTTAGSPYLLTGEVQIASGATLTIAPGVAVLASGQALSAFGTLVAVGTEAEPVRFESVDITARGGHVRIEHGDIRGGSLFSPNLNAAYHTRLELRDSRISDLRDYVYVWYPRANVYIERNVFWNSGGISVGTGDSGPSDTTFVRNNVFMEQRTPYAVENWASYGDSRTIVEHNAFFTTHLVALRLGFDPSAAMIAANNYWATTDEGAIGARIFDRADDLRVASFIDFRPPLALPHPATPIP